MAQPRKPVDIDHLVELYDEGLALDGIAGELGVSRKVVRNRLSELGLETDRRRVDLDDSEIVRLYESGMTKHAIAASMGVGDMTVSKRLSELGYPTEGRSAAMATRLSRMSPEERFALASRARDAVRGTTKTHSDLCKRAATKAAIGKPGSECEAAIGRM